MTEQFTPTTDPAVIALIPLREPYPELPVYDFRSELGPDTEDVYTSIDMISRTGDGKFFVTRDMFDWQAGESLLPVFDELPDLLKALHTWSHDQDFTVFNFEDAFDWPSDGPETGVAYVLRTVRTDE